MQLVKPSKNMKELFLVSIFAFCLNFATHAQTKPLILTTPANWQLEQFSLPPGFAPTLKYKGIEELRFSPDMFKKDATGYFTYVFAARLDSTKNVSKTDIKNYLLTYFKGLCRKTAADRKLNPVDTSAISVSIERKKTAQKETVYNILLNAFGVFTDGAPVTLNMEVKVMNDVAGQRVYLLFIVSPQPKTDALWQELYKVQKEFVIPLG
jgi:hypothetical protein